MLNKKNIGIFALSILLASAAAVPALADDQNNNGGGWGQAGAPGQMMKQARGGMMGRGEVKGGRGTYGTVTAVSGNTITMTVKVPVAPAPNTTGTTTTPPVPTFTTQTYTVDATNAKIMKAGATIAVSAIVVGDNVMVQGTLNGTSIAASRINDGVQLPPMMGRGVKKGGDQGDQNEGNDNNGQGDNKNGQNGQMMFQGNGQPIVAGKVTAISGNSVTITNKSNVTYTVDVTNAKIQKGGTAGTVAGITVGDTLVVQGSINGGAVVASTIIDQPAPAANTTGGQNQNENRGGGGFFGGIGRFFSGIFGF